MDDEPSPTVDRAISCALVAGVICMTLVILAIVLIVCASPA
jgi:hypothetical protein